MGTSCFPSLGLVLFKGFFYLLTPLPSCVPGVYPGGRTIPPWPSSFRRRILPRKFTGGVSCRFKLFVCRRNVFFRPRGSACPTFRPFFLLFCQPPGPMSTHSGNFCDIGLAFPACEALRFTSFSFPFCFFFFGDLFTVSCPLCRLFLTASRFGSGGFICLFPLYRAPW